MTDHAPEAVAAWLKSCVEDLSGKDVPALDQDIFETGVIDSFGAIELIERMEGRYAIRFDEADFLSPRFKTVRGLAELIAEKTPA